MQKGWWAAQIWLGSNGSASLDLDLTAAAGGSGSTRGWWLGCGSARGSRHKRAAGGGGRLGNGSGAALASSVRSAAVAGASSPELAEIGRTGTVSSAG